MDMVSAVVATTIHIKRNLTNYNFAISLSERKTIEIFEYIKAAILRIHEALGDNFIFEVKLFSEMSKASLEKLKAEGIIPQNMQKRKGSGIAICKECFIIINLDDHLTIGSVFQNSNPNSNINKQLDTLITVEKTLGEILPFAFDEELGFLTSSVDYIGTGVKFTFLTTCYFMINTKKHAEKIKEHINKKFSLFLISAGEKKEHSQVLFNIASSHSHFENVTIQLEKTLSDMSGLAQLENDECSCFAKNFNDEAYDFVLRAFLLVKNVLFIPEHNLPGLLGSLRFGVNMGFLKNINLEKLDSLFLGLKNPFVLEKFSNDSKILSEGTEKMLDKERATILRHEFKNVEMGNLKK